MVATGDLTWRLSGTSPADGDVISAVLDPDAAKLSYGPFWFDVCAPAHLPEKRRFLEAEYPQRLGRALVDDVARLVRLEMEF